MRILKRRKEVCKCPYCGMICNFSEDERAYCEHYDRHRGEDDYFEFLFSKDGMREVTCRFDELSARGKNCILTTILWAATLESLNPKRAHHLIEEVNGRLFDAACREERAREERALLARGRFVVHQGGG